MKSALLLTVSLVALGFVGTANAADMRAPVYKAPAMAAPAWSWTGFYIGVNIGGGIGRNPTTQSVAGGGGAGGAVANYNASPAGVVGGGQIGYNYQFAPNWVFGLEADFQGSSQDETTCSLTCFVSTNQKLDFFGTARARLGYTNGDWMYYVTGGGAWGQIKQSTSIDFGGGSVGNVSGTHSQGGWTVGGGVETHLWGGWTAKAEYLYVDLGSISDSIIVAGPGGGSFTTSSDVREHIVRAGVNYKF